MADNNTPHNPVAADRDAGTRQPPKRADSAGGSDAATSDLSAVKNIGNELLGAVRDRTDSLLTEQKGRAADEIEAVAKMVRNVASTVEASGQDAIAGYTEQAADQIGDFAARIRKASWGELATDAEDLARRWPMLFMASAMGVGFLAGRFLLASRPSGSGSSTGSGMSASHPAARPGALPAPVSSEARAGYGASSGMERH